MEYIDVHCHLEGERFAKDLDAVVKAAESKNVKIIINSGVNPETNRKTLDLSRRYSIIKASFGLYPIDVLISKFPGLNDDSPRKIKPFDYKDELKWIQENMGECVAIGEIGLDFKVIESHKNFQEIKLEQVRIFEELIEFAKKNDKPMIIHSRGAEKEAIEILEKHAAIRVVMHCFSGNKSLIKRVAENGWYLSIPPVITRLQHFQTVVSMVDIKQLLTETDSPYLSPISGERNEPANVIITIKEIARIKNASEVEVAKKIMKNYEDLF